MTKVLEEDGRFEVRIANNGFDAGMMVKEYRPDLIVLDVMLPDINGKEVCQRVRADPTLEDVRILCICGMVEEDKIQDLQLCRRRRLPAQAVRHRGAHRADVRQLEIETGRAGLSSSAGRERSRRRKRASESPTLLDFALSDVFRGDLRAREGGGPGRGRICRGSAPTPNSLIALAERPGEPLPVSSSADPALSPSSSLRPPEPDPFGSQPSALTRPPSRTAAALFGRDEAGVWLRASSRSVAFAGLSAATAAFAAATRRRTAPPRRTAATAARLAPLGWYAVAAVDPFDAADPLRRPAVSDPAITVRAGGLGFRPGRDRSPTSGAMATAHMGATTIGNR